MMSEVAAKSIARLNSRSSTGWLLVGFALGGFFDGIVLHQILQWHHLLSGLDDLAGSDIHFQITMDGLFHLLMYLIAVIGAWLLVTARAEDSGAGATSQILRLVLIGFGMWHVVDAIVSHWLLGLHRIRMDSDIPLFWDIAWLLVFGILPLLIAFLLPPAKRGGSSSGVAAAIATVVMAAGLVAGMGPRFGATTETIIVFRQDLEPDQRMAAVLEAGSRMKWTDTTGTIWAVDEVSWRGLATLYSNGALLISTTPMVAGCLAWTRPG